MIMSNNPQTYKLLISIEIMKSVYPSYKKGTSFIEERLSIFEKKTLKDFLTFCGQSAQDHKVKARKYEILVCRDIIEKPFDKWTLEDIRAFLSFMNNSDKAGWTKKCITTTLNMFLKFNWEDWSLRFKNLEDFRKFNKGLNLRTDKKYSKDKQLTPEEADLMLRASDNYKDKAYLSIAFEGGLPPAVELNLRWSDIKFEEDGITRVNYFRNKNKDSFAIPLKTSTKYLKDWKQHYSFPNIRKDDLVFPSRRNRDKPVSNNTMWLMLKRLSKLAGVEKNIYQYLLRHGRLSESYEKLPEEVHRKLYGHKRGSQMTKVYSHVDEDKAFREALNILHHVEELPLEVKTKLEKQVIILQKENKRSAQFMANFGNVILRMKEQGKKNLDLDDLLQVIKL